MKKMFNERHAHMEELPTDLEILSELNKRVALSLDLKKKLNELENKDNALNKVLHILEKYSKEHWLYMTNVAVDYHNLINCNLLVMTSTHLYTLEVNDYEGTFTFEEGISRLNGKILDEHPIPMAQSVLAQLQSYKLMAPVPIDLTLKSAAVFTNPNLTLQIEDAVKDVELVPAKELEKYVRKMVREEKQARKKGSPFNPLYLSWVMRIDRHHPILPLEIPEDIMEKVRPGILCSHCGSADVKVGEVLMACDCGGWESAEEAILRTTYEYCNLSNVKHLDLPSICAFFEGQVSADHVEKCLEKFLVPMR